MRNRIVVGIGLVLCLALAATSFAATPAAPALKRAEGRIVAVDAKAMTLEVKVGGRDERFTLTQSTQILAGGASATVGALAPGEIVRIEYKLENGHAIASKVDRLGGHSAAKGS